jgi:hypothetical protein
MAKLPRPSSRQAHSIGSAIAEGRAEDALDQLVSALGTGTADKAVQIEAARWIEAVGLRPGDAKKLRGGRPALPKEWLEIADMVVRLQDEGHIRAEADRRAAEHFGYSRRHVENCVARWHEAKEEARQYE